MKSIYWVVVFVAIFVVTAEAKVDGRYKMIVGSGACKVSSASVLMGYVGKISRDSGKSEDEVLRNLVAATRGGVAESMDCSSILATLKVMWDRGL